MKNCIFAGTDISIFPLAAPEITGINVESATLSGSRVSWLKMFRCNLMTVRAAEDKLLLRRNGCRLLGCAFAGATRRRTSLVGYNIEDANTRESKGLL